MYWFTKKTDEADFTSEEYLASKLPSKNAKHRTEQDWSAMWDYIESLQRTVKRGKREKKDLLEENHEWYGQVQKLTGELEAARENNKRKESEIEVARRKARIASRCAAEMAVELNVCHRRLDNKTRRIVDLVDTEVHLKAQLAEKVVQLKQTMAELAAVHQMSDGQATDSSAMDGTVDGTASGVGASDLDDAGSVIVEVVVMDKGAKNDKMGTSGVREEEGKFRAGGNVGPMSTLLVKQESTDTVIGVPVATVRTGEVMRSVVCAPVAKSAAPDSGPSSVLVSGCKSGELPTKGPMFNLLKGLLALRDEELRSNTVGNCRGSGRPVGLLGRSRWW